LDGFAFVQMVEAELKRRGISKEQFYRESGISSATMSQWRKRIYSPSSAAIKKIEDYLGIVFSIEQKEKDQPIAQGDELTTDLLELMETAKSLPKEKLQALLQVARSIK
jgi:transcriptional regulator with XRE-family HTH domain